ncbi:MAG TPA: hypothetical protein DGD08_18610 [Gemmatimonas aurantiaca]|nr:hypothetical protein [Gemmatimonas aurantiaca]
MWDMPHFGYSQSFSLEHLRAIVRLSPGRPVFLATATDGSEVVLKQEVLQHAGEKENLKFALKVMKTGSDSAKGKILTDTEVRALQDYIDTYEYIADVLGKELDPDKKALKTCLDEQNGAWFKMDKGDGVVDMKGARERAAAGDKSGIRDIAAALNATDGLESLGRIVACDLWNGNADRFSPHGTGRSDLIVTTNVSNVLLSVQNGNLKPIGLDAYEAMGAYRDMRQTLDNLEFGDYWSGRLLGTAQSGPLTQFCKQIVEDLETMLGPRNRKNLLGRKKRLVSNAVNRLKHGIVSGALPIKAKMRQVAGKPNPPAGLIDRLTALNWWP